MTSPQRRKGNNAEREIAGILTDLLGLKVRRRLQEGRSDDAGDLEGLPGVCAQVKSYSDVQRAIREALHDLPAQMEAAGATHGVGFIRRPGGQWLAVQSIEQWSAMYRETLT